MNEYQKIVFEKLQNNHFPVTVIGNKLLVSGYGYIEVHKCKNDGSIDCFSKDEDDLFQWMEDITKGYRRYESSNQTEFEKDTENLMVIMLKLKNMFIEYVDDDL